MKLHLFNRPLSEDKNGDFLSYRQTAGSMICTVVLSHGKNETEEFYKNKVLVGKRFSHHTTNSQENRIGSFEIILNF